MEHYDIHYTTSSTLGYLTARVEILEQRQWDHEMRLRDLTAVPKKVTSVFPTWLTPFLPQIGAVALLFVIEYMVTGTWLGAFRAALHAAGLTQQ